MCDYRNIQIEQISFTGTAGGKISTKQNILLQFQPEFTSNLYDYLNRTCVVRTKGIFAEICFLKIIEYFPVDELTRNNEFYM